VGFFGIKIEIKENSGSDAKAAAYEEILKYFDKLVYSYSHNRISAIIVHGTARMMDDERKSGSADSNSEKSLEWIDTSTKLRSASEKKIKAATEANITMIFLK
jgi:hypothetical protein